MEFGCGYGTFTLPVARRVQQLYSFDIEEEMVKNSKKRIEKECPELNERVNLQA